MNHTASRDMRRAVRRTEWALLYSPSSPSAGHVFGGPVRSEREPVWSDRYLPEANADKVRVRRTVVEGQWERVDAPATQAADPAAQAASAGPGASTLTVGGLSTNARADR